MKYTVELHAGEKDWLASRLNGIGASECAAVVNRSRWCGPRGLYIRKLEGRVEDDDSDHPDAKEMGKRHENTIIGLFKDYGPELEPFWRIGKRQSPYTIYRSVERPHIFCTPDLPIYGMGDALVSTLECKASFYEAFKAWKRTVPLSHQLQCQQTMYVMGLEKMFIAVLGNGLEFRWHPVERDQELIDKLLPRLDRFWDCVQRRDPPEVDGLEDTTHALRDYYGDGDPSKEIQLDWGYADMAERLDAVTAAKKKAEAEESLLKNKLRDAMGEATTALLADGSKVTWKTDSRGVRSFRRKPPQQARASA